MIYAIYGLLRAVPQVPDFFGGNSLVVAFTLHHITDMVVKFHVGHLFFLPG
jgi:hypothetical protein